MKRTILLVVILLFGMLTICGCGEKKSPENDTKTETTGVTTDGVVTTKNVTTNAPKGPRTIVATVMDIMDGCVYLAPTEERNPESEEIPYAFYWVIADQPKAPEVEVYDIINLTLDEFYMGEYIWGIHEVLEVEVIDKFVPNWPQKVDVEITEEMKEAILADAVPKATELAFSDAWMKIEGVPYFDNYDSPKIQAMDRLPEYIPNKEREPEESEYYFEVIFIINGEAYFGGSCSFYYDQKFNYLGRTGLGC